MPKPKRKQTREFMRELEVQRHEEWRDEIDNRLDNEDLDIESVALLTEALAACNGW